jgi:hypothetical protein
MDRDTHRAVGVGHDEGEPFGALGRLGPAKRGETSEPSHVYLGGISPPGPNAGLRSLKALADAPDPAAYIYLARTLLRRPATSARDMDVMVLRPCAWSLAPV